MLPPSLSPTASMYITVSNMNVIEIKSNLPVHHMILWPNVRPEGGVCAENVTGSGMIGIEVVGAACV